MTDERPISGREMCETIVRANILRRADGTAPTAEEIWAYSPTGELSQIFEWYEQAKAVLAEDTHDG